MYIETFDTEKISKARDRWSSLSETDLRAVGNDSERLVDMLSRKGGMDRDQASREVDEFLKSCGCCEGGAKRDADPSASRNSAQGGSARSSAQQSGNKPGTSNDDQTGEMAAAQAGRRTRPDTKKL